MKKFFLCSSTVVLILAVALSGCGGSSGKGGSNGGNGGNGGNGSEPTATISGTVTLSGTETPIPGATITTSPVTSTVLTDPEGKYSLKVPAPVPTTYTVTAAKEGFLPASKPQTVAAGGTVSVNFELMPEIAGGICGLIRAGGLPRSGIRVKVGDDFSITDTSGNYSIPLGPGTYLAEVSMDNYATLEFRFTVSSAEEMVVKDINMVEDAYLQAYYKLNKNAEDAHGDKNGTLSGPSGTDDRFDRGDNALSFDGNDDYVQLPATFDNPGNAMTIAAWIKLNELPDTESVIYYSGENGKFYFFVDNEGKLGLTYELEDGSSGTKDSGGSVPIGQWVHVAVTRNGDNLTFYINAQHDGTWTGLTDKLFKDGGPSDFCFIGVKGGDTSFFSGCIDEVRIYHALLDEMRIESLALWDIN